MNFKDILKATVYKNDIELFFKEELRITPSKDQLKFLEWLMDLNNDKILVIAGRGAGKTKMCAGFALWAVIPLAISLNHPYFVAILGGSRSQSDYCYDYIRKFLAGSEWLSSFVRGDILRSEVSFSTGGKITPLPAGPKSIRGIHPDCLILDEGAEIERKIVEAALPITSTSPFPRIIWASTGHVPDCFFLDVWQKADALGYKIFTWSALASDAWWVNKKKVEKDKLEMGTEKWETEYLAKPASLMDTLIPNDDFKRSIIEATTFDPALPTIAGCDWGEVHSAFLVLQRQGKISYVLEAKEWKRVKLLRIEEEIKRFCEKYEIDTIWADASHPGMNERLITAGLHVKPVHITKEKKPLLQDNLKWRYERGTIKVGKDKKKLLEEISVYTSTTRRNDHLVDCYSPDTQVLTRMGWKRISNTSSDDEIATLNLQGYLEYQNPIGIIEEDFIGKAIELKGRAINLLVTPNHRLFVALSKGANKYTPYKLVKAKELLNRHFKCKKDAEWSGLYSENFELPFCPTDKFHPKVNRKLGIPLKDWLGFLGLFISEGSASSNCVTIAQKEGRKKDGMRKILRKLPFTWKETSDRFYCYSKQLTSYCKQFGKAKEKFLPREVLNLDRKLLEELMSALMLGDGCRNIYYTTSRKLADQVQEIALKIGKCASVKLLRKKNEGIIRDRLIRGGSIYSVNFSEKHLRPKVNYSWKGHNGAKLREIPYEGKMYCLTVPNHVIYVRRNGHPIWSGNSLMLALDGEKSLPAAYPQQEGLPVAFHKEKAEGGRREWAHLVGTRR